MRGWGWNTAFNREDDNPVLRPHRESDHGKLPTPPIPRPVRRTSHLLSFAFPPWFGDSSLNSTIPELPGSGWLAAEPEATPQTHRLRPWGFPTVSPSHPNVFPHHGIQRISVEFSEESPGLRFLGPGKGCYLHRGLETTCLILCDGVIHLHRGP